MGLRLKENLLVEILGNSNTPTKYSKGLLNLKTIFELEQKEKFKIPKAIILLFEKLVLKEDNFINNIPLILIERSFILKSSNLNSYINLQYKEFELTKNSGEVFILLEDFYKEMFLIAGLMASFYNLEIKINVDKNHEDLI